MRTTIDPAGRIVVPKAIRDRLGLHGGQDVDITERNGTIEITPAVAAVTLVEADGVVVGVASEDLPPLTDEDVRRALEDARR